MITPSSIPLFPHRERQELVRRDGRPYFRQYIPNFFDGYTPESFFFTEFQDVVDFVHRHNKDTEIIVSPDPTYDPEIFIMIFYPATKKFYVMGWMQNFKPPEGYRTFEQLKADEGL